MTVDLKVSFIVGQIGVMRLLSYVVIWKWSGWGGPAGRVAELELFVVVRDGFCESRDSY